jgi:hypothetical protein
MIMWKLCKVIICEAASLSCAFLLGTPKYQLPIDYDDDGPHRDGDHES